jgi:hypothetical protein
VATTALLPTISQKLVSQAVRIGVPVRARNGEPDPDAVNVDEPDPELL